MTQCRNTF